MSDPIKTAEHCGNFPNSLCRIQLNRLFASMEDARSFVKNNMPESKIVHSFQREAWIVEVETPVKPIAVKKKGK